MCVGNEVSDIVKSSALVTDKKEYRLGLWNMPFQIT